MEGYIQIKKIDYQPNKFGNDLKISMVGLYDENGKWIKWVKLDGFIKTLLENNKIPVKL